MEKKPNDLVIIIPLLNPTILDRVKRLWRWGRERVRSSSSSSPG